MDLLVDEMVVRKDEVALRVDDVIVRVDEVVPPVEDWTGLAIPLGGTVAVGTLLSSEIELSVTVVGISSTASVVDVERVLFEGLVVPTCLLIFSPKLRGYMGFPY